MGLIEQLKTFWKQNKYSYLWSCLAFTFVALFLGAIKNLDMKVLSLAILASFPLVFLMAFGIYGITGGDKE